MWEVSYKEEAVKQLKTLSKVNQKQVLNKIEILASFENPNLHPQVKFLTGPLRKYFRLRVSSIRVIFQIDFARKQIIIFTVLHRKNAYR